MSDSTFPAQLEAARAYEALFVPSLFGFWAKEVAEVAAIGPGQRILDVACGTGILARECKARAGPTATVAGIDANPGMIAVARTHAPDIDFREGVAEALPFPDRTFDAVVCQFALMFFGDRHRALREMQRVLIPGGRLALAVWDSLDAIAAYAAEVAVVERVAGRAASDALRAPFALGDRRELAALLSASGLASADISTHEGKARFPGIRTLVEADLRGWLPIMGVTLDEPRIARVLQEAETALGGWRGADGSVAFPVSAHLVTARGP